jgi:hypothetical protein
MTKLDTNALDTVTGGRHNSSTDLLNNLNTIADQVKCLTQKTSGFDNNTFLLFAALAVSQQRNQHANVVYVGAPRWRCW